MINDNLIITVSSIAAITLVLGVGIVRCTEPGDRVAQALAVCGDTPNPVFDSNPSRYVSTYVEKPPGPYKLAVESVDSCRKAVLEHFSNALPPH